MPRRVKLQPKSDNQRDYLYSLNDPAVNYVSVFGPAGTGKSYLAAYYIAQELLEDRIKKIYIARSVITLPTEKIGFLPGGVSDKYEPFLEQMTEYLEEFIPNFDRYLNRFEILPLGMVRGRSLRDSIIWCDEAQNLSYDVLKALITRVDDSSKLILSGDLEQSDLAYGHTDFEEFCDRLETMVAFEVVELDDSDQARNKNITEINKRLKRE